MNSSVWILTLSTLTMLVSVVITYWIHSRSRLDVVVASPPNSGLHEQPPSPALPLISVIVPARNEGRNIRRCVEALLSQDYPNYELIVVEDRSTDVTPDILAALQSGSPRLRVIQGNELPSGWAGKPHALTLGVEAAQGSWLCFVDADTFATPTLLSATYHTAQIWRADLFSILTAQELGTFWEKVILPVVFTALSFGFPPSRVNDPHTPDAIANGQFILIRRSVYEAVGGHHAVYDQIAEDRALAELVKRRGYRLIVANGQAVAHTRMYTSFAEIWEGWTKNIYLGMQGRVGELLLGASLGLLCALVLPLWLIGSLLWLAAGGGWVAAIVTTEAILYWAYLLGIRSQVSKAFGISRLYALTLPLAALIFVAMILASTYKVLSGQGVTWKGRKYRVSS